MWQYEHLNQKYLLKAPKLETGMSCVDDIYIDKKLGIVFPEESDSIPLTGKTSTW